MATYYDQTFTIGAFSYTIRVDMHTSQVDLGDGRMQWMNAITATNYDGNTTSFLVKDEDIDRETTRISQDNIDGINSAPNAAVDALLINKGYTRH